MHTTILPGASAVGVVIPDQALDSVGYQHLLSLHVQLGQI